MGYHDSLPRSLAMTATLDTNCTVSKAPVLYLALNLGGGCGARKFFTVRESRPCV